MTTKNRYPSLLGTLLTSFLIAGTAQGVPPAHAVSLAQARELALQKVPGQLLEEETGKENGHVIYSFEIRRKGAAHGATEIKIDASEGTIVLITNHDQDDDHDERGEAPPRR